MNIPSLTFALQRYVEQVRRLEYQRDELLALVEQVEWCEMPGLRCPWCEESIDDGHAKGCPRQAAIRKATGK